KKKRAGEIERAAADSTGFETRPASRYFVRRRDRTPGRWQTTTYRRFGKMGLLVDCDTHLILSTHRGLGPRPDTDQLRPLLKRCSESARPRTLLADAGYDSESNHKLLREELGIESIIPAKIGRPSASLPTGAWRALMATEFDDEIYGQRWQSETVMYMIKQHQGESLTAHRYQSRRREMGLMAVTHNVMIVSPDKRFYNAGQVRLIVSLGQGGRLRASSRLHSTSDAAGAEEAARGPDLSGLRDRP